METDRYIKFSMHTYWAQGNFFLFLIGKIETLLDESPKNYLREIMLLQNVTNCTEF